MNEEETLLEAARIIERDGWHQGAYYTPAGFIGARQPDESWDDYKSRLGYEWWLAEHTGPVCALGAIARAINENGSAIPRVDQDEGHFIYRVVSLLAGTPSITQHCGGPLDVIPTWNDSPTTTAEDVILNLKAAAERARETD